MYSSCMIHSAPSRACANVSRPGAHAPKPTSSMQRRGRMTVYASVNTPDSAAPLTPSQLGRRALVQGGSALLCSLPLMGLLSPLAVWAEEEVAVQSEEQVAAVQSEEQVAVRAEEQVEETEVEVQEVSTPTGEVYEDPIDKFEIFVPPGWARGEGALSGATGFTGATGARRTIALFPDDVNVRDVSVSVVVTNVSVEFTKLGSFGNIESFAGNLINSLDRSYLLKSRIPVKDPIQIAKLVDYSSTGGGQAYNVEYTIQKLPGPQRHLYSTVVLGSNGRYNRLYTVTAQCLEEDLPTFGPALKQALASFKANLQPSY